MAEAFTGGADHLARSLRQMSTRSMSKRSLSSSGSKRNWASASIREVWGNQGDVFGKSGREDDEEELKWAAIERLPTYDRLRKGILKQDLGDGVIVYEEVDLGNLAMQEKKQLMENILNAVQEDNEKFLFRLRERTDRGFLDSLEFSHQRRGRLRYYTILTLLLGPPGSGKTTLMQALSGRREKDLRISGKITYCGHELNEFVPQRTCAYISQHDLHHGEMTVRETLNFSGRCMGVGHRYELLAELLRREKQAGIKPDPEVDAFMKAMAMSGQEANVVTDYVLKNAIVLNEFLDDRWSAPNPDPSFPQPTVGKVLLKTRGMFMEEYWYWISVGALLGFSLLFNILFMAALTYLNPLGDSKSIPPDEVDHKKKLSSTEQHKTKASESTPASATSKTEGKNSFEITESAYGEQPTKKRGMVLPFQPLSLAFDHMNYYVDMPAMFVEEVMDLVELNSLRNSIVGLPGVDGLSTEQRKRLTIAVELVANPSIIFMDEPTSGLDARAAAIVMRTVRNTVDTGRTVVCTIHQPSIDIFEAFDELLLMKRGGRVIYFGQLGRHSHKLIEYFEDIDGVPKITDGYNPATWMLEVSSTAVESQLNVDFADVYANSKLYQRNQELIKELSTPEPGSKDLYFPTKYSQDFFTQCKACFLKQEWSYWKNPRYNAVRMFMTLVVGLIFGLIFWNKGQQTKKHQDLQNLLGAIYSAVTFLGAANTSAVMSIVSIERTVFYRERAAGMYSELPYAFAQVSIEAIYVAIQTFVYSVVLYVMIGFPWQAANFFWFYFFIFMCFMYFTLYGMMLVALTPGHQIAAIVMCFFVSFWNLFSGFLIPRTEIPIWWRWYYWASPVAWTIYGLITSQVGNIGELMDVPGDGLVPVKDYLKAKMGFEYDFLGPVAGAHVGFVLLFLFVFAYGIKFLNFQRR
ncbi:hypothetical protein Tsubulata_036271 [Turnera subulata]|uniref:ABC transporter domain-containing protein n=1 Tax=Turnera subulata TaxID=218843 RepID=A0A9Q0JHE6_9ROSI|nr:hypothetical protein Tsubulata_036271 [Turnera subulata]